MKPINYLDLARQARIEGNNKLFWMYFKNFARSQRKLWAKEKALLTRAGHR